MNLLLSGARCEKRWAELIYKIYEVDPLTCRQCGEKRTHSSCVLNPANAHRRLDAAPAAMLFLPHNVFDQIPNASRAKNLLQSSRSTDCSSG